MNHVAVIRHRPRRSVVAAKLAVLSLPVALLLVAGCAGAAAAPPAAPIGTLPTAGSPVVTLLDISDQDLGLLEWAEQVLTAECMRAAGFEYVVADRDSFRRDPADRASVERERFPYDATTEGMPYAPRVVSGSDLSRDPNRAYVEQLSPAARAAYSEAAISGEMTEPVMGMQTSTGGCLTDARTQLYGDINVWLVSGFVTNLPFSVSANVQSDPRVLDAMHAWQSCMRRAGFDFEMFNEARNAAVGKPATQAMAIATADSSCTDQSGLGTTFRAVYAAELAREVDDNAALVAEFLAARTEAIARATTLLERQG